MRRRRGKTHKEVAHAHHYPTEFRSMTRKERTSAFKGFTDQEKDAVMNLMTDEQKERLVQDIRYQAVLDFRRGK